MSTSEAGMMANQNNQERNSNKSQAEENKSRSPILVNNNSMYCWQSAPNITQYVKNLEGGYEELQKSFLDIASQFARLQFRVRQYLQAEPDERSVLLKDLERLARDDAGFNPPSEKEEDFPPILSDNKSMGDIKSKQNAMIESLRSKIANLNAVCANVSTDYGDDDFHLHIYHEHSLLLDSHQMKTSKSNSSEDMKHEKRVSIDPSLPSTTTKSKTHSRSIEKFSKY